MASFVSSYGGQKAVSLICHLSLPLSYTSFKATTSRFVRATCGSVYVGSIAHPQQSRRRSLTWAID